MARQLLPCTHPIVSSTHLLPLNTYISPHPSLQLQLINSLSVTIAISHLSLSLSSSLSERYKQTMLSDISHSGRQLSLSLHTAAVKPFSATQIFTSRVKAIMLTGNNRLHFYSHALHFMFLCPK